MPYFEHNSEKFGYINLETMDGVQKGLKSLGHDPGAIDGKDGPSTQRAVRQFQASLSIKIDGIVGPETRQSLMSELQLRAEGPSV
ncbi:MAG TPA: peptidoglycan-binding domain-containing protein [Polyangiaceae bacterium]|nr:peptidoglycan-binding domain-containing protein [Polyangiaceae bacterium]